MKIGDIGALVKKGESKTVEFKRNFDTAALETVCAFANASGGILFIGIEDGKIANKEFQIGDETLQKWIN